MSAFFLALKYATGIFFTIIVFKVIYELDPIAYEEKAISLSI